MELKKYSSYYFLGIGGIGMSALARYFHQIGFKVSGYDKTPTTLTDELIKEGITVSFEDKGADIENEIEGNEKTLIVYTPAIPLEHKEFNYFKNNNYTLVKRAALLGGITKTKKTLAVAGTHGKTTTSCLLAHLLQVSPLKCSAFLGGISTNYNTNLLINPASDWVVVEADEFDRSFLHLHPYASIITSTDADHLDIYKTKQELEKAFEEYALQINEDGVAIIQNEIHLKSTCKQLHYAINETKASIDYSASNLHYQNAVFYFDLDTPTTNWKKIAFGISGIHNVENAVAVIALGLELGLTEKTIREALATFKGVKRRFEYHINSTELVYVDDYAHHPTAINQLVVSLRLRHKGWPIIAIFQPHLFSRTSDFMDEFAKSLSQVDELYLLPIYPARELPIEGITSEALLEKVEINKKWVCQPNEITTQLTKRKNCVIVTIGAGNIDQLVSPLKEALT